MTDLGKSSHMYDRVSLEYRPVSCLLRIINRHFFRCDVILPGLYSVTSCKLANSFHQLTAGCVLSLNESI